MKYGQEERPQRRAAGQIVEERESAEGPKKIRRQVFLEKGDAKGRHEKKGRHALIKAGVI